MTDGMSMDEARAELARIKSLPSANDRPVHLRCTPVPSGTGPAGETCRTCKHLCHTGHDGKYLKCGLCREMWTHGPATDLRARWPACAKWETKEDQQNANA